MLADSGWSGLPGWVPLCSVLRPQEAPSKAPEGGPETGPRLPPPIGGGHTSTIMLADWMPWSAGTGSPMQSPRDSGGSEQGTGSDYLVFSQVI